MAAGLLCSANKLRYKSRRSATATAVCRRSCNLFQGPRERTLSNADNLLWPKAANRDNPPGKGAYITCHDRYFFIRE